MSGMKLAKDLVAASAAPLVLTILAESENYGYAIVKRVEELSDGEIAWTDGLLYPLLHRLEDSGQIESRWGVADTGRRRRYYAITPAGTAALAEHREQWNTVARALARAWGTPGPPVLRAIHPASRQTPATGARGVPTLRIPTLVRRPAPAIHRTWSPA